MAELVLFEDNRATRELLSLYLARNGHQVRAYSGEEDPRLLLTRAPADLILLDLDLGQVSGVDLCRQLRQLPPPFGRTPILILSSSGAQEIERLNLAVDGYIVKMTSANDVLQQINAFLASRPSNTNAGFAARASQLEAWDSAEWSTESLSSATSESNHHAFIALDHQVLDLLGADIGMDVLRQIMDVFIEDLAERSQHVRMAIHRSDHEHIQHQAHALKSSAATYGATQLTILCNNIGLAHAGEQISRIIDHAQALQDVAELTIGAIHHYLANRAG